MRILDRKRTMHNLNDLGMPPEVHENYAKIVKSPWGMVVVAGPTGSGKTTTLYATLNDVNDPKMNITTLEDPVEFVFPTINQIQLNEQAGTTFATGLRAILRQDPDIILVGEIRDLETARLAVQAALTGHFVLSTIHATDSPSALHRFVDMGVERFLIASSVTLIVSQRLLRRICQHCRQPYEPSVEEQAFFAQHSHDKRKTKFWHGEGCNFCAGTGYSDRIGIYELLKMTDEIRQLVLENAVHEEIKKMAISQGMSTLLDEGMKLVHRDVTTVADVMRHVYTV
jgi:type IV pilus assembly protein PilB